LKSFLLAVFSLFLAVNLSAQNVPANYTLENPSDFRQYEQSVITGIKWLAQTPRNSQIENRQDTEDFLVKWIYGCPYVKVIIEPYVMKLSSKNANLLLSFMFGYTLYKLDHLDDKDLVAANVAGLNMLLDDYKNNIDALKKDPVIEQITEVRTAGNLSQWVLPKLGNVTN
jgi:hypothetical protein